MLGTFFSRKQSKKDPAPKGETPSPQATAERLGIAAEGEPLAQVIKTYHLPHTGKLSLARVWRGTISEGMIPKAECCIDALNEGVAKTHIIDGRLPHALLLEIFTHTGIGTEIARQDAQSGPAGSGRRPVPAKS